MKKELLERVNNIETLVRATFEKIEKPVTHTQLFWEMFPGAPDGKESIQKWNDIGRVITKMVNDGDLKAQKVEGKRRTTFVKVPKENAPENEEGSGI